MNPLEAIKSFYDTICKMLPDGQYGRIMIVVGGGRLSRYGDEVLSKVTMAHKGIERDLIGIAATRYNAELMNRIFGCHYGVWGFDTTEEEIKYFLEPKGHEPVLCSSSLGMSHKIQISSGWEPGTSTDGVSFSLAKISNIKTVIKVGTPVREDENEKSQVIHDMTWDEYLEVFSSDREPSGRVPIDRDAALMAQRYGIGVIIGKLIDFSRSQADFVKNGTTIK